MFLNLRNSRILHICYLKRQFSIKIYTKTGDKGTSQLFSGERRAKYDQVFQTLGSVDEANSMIGLARQFVDSKENQSLLKIENAMDEIMSRLFDVGSSIATPIDTASTSKLSRATFHSRNVDKLETMIDELDAELDPLKNFILPSGGICAAHLHCARALTRRAEREATKLLEDKQLESSVTIYLNRLSDYLFTAARYVSKFQGHNEITYKKQQNSGS